MADLYREKVTQLALGLGYDESRTAAAEALRGLIDAIVLTPQEGKLKIELQGIVSHGSCERIVAVNVRRSVCGTTANVHVIGPLVGDGASGSPGLT